MKTIFRIEPLTLVAVVTALSAPLALAAGCSDEEAPSNQSTVPGPVEVIPDGQAPPTELQLSFTRMTIPGGGGAADIAFVPNSSKFLVTLGSGQLLYGDLTDNDVGQVAQIDHANSTQSFAYDSRGQVWDLDYSYAYLDEADPEVPNDVDEMVTVDVGTFTRTYDEVGRNTRLEYPNGQVRTQDFDTLGRLTQRCYEYPTGPTRCYDAEYDLSGNPDLLTDPDGTSRIIEYDAQNRVTNVEGEGAYDYNALGALSVHADVDVDHQRPRLDNGEPSSAGIPASVDAGDVFLTTGGNVTAIGDSTIGYNHRASLLTSLDDVGTDQDYEFSYNFNLQRSVARNFGTGDVEWYQYQGDNISTISDGNGVAGVKYRYLYDGIDHPLWMYHRDGGGEVYFEVDTLGNVRRLMTPDGDSVGGYDYTAFGRTLEPTDDVLPSDFAQPLRWQGRPLTSRS